MEYVLEVNNIKKIYDNKEVLKGITFNVKRGEIFTIVGPNGAGKTTTIEIIEGIRKLNSGKIVILDRNKVDEYVKEKIGVQLQDGSLMDNLKPKELISFFRSMYNSGFTTNEVLKMVDLQNESNKIIKKLSGGQKKRLLLALAVINDPDLLFLDEPTTGIDPAIRREIWDVIINFKKRNKTIIMTTHYMDEAEKISDRVAILNKGEIVALDNPLNLILKSNIENKISFKLEDNSTTIQNDLMSLSKKCFISNNKYDIFTSDLEKTLSKLFQIIKKKDTKISDIYIKQPSLEDVFLMKTGVLYNNNIGDSK